MKLTKAEHFLGQNISWLVMKAIKKFKIKVKPPFYFVTRQKSKICRGFCTDDQQITVYLMNHDTYEDLVDTVAHELAHCRYFKHDCKWRKFYKTIKIWMMKTIK